ncbi:hypothetical protein JCM3774_001444 [Rhodotorula dairenensis]
MPQSPSASQRGTTRLIEQLSVSLDKAKVALAECCTDGSAHAALSLSLFQQAISKLDETRYMVRRSIEEDKRSHSSRPPGTHSPRSAHDGNRGQASRESHEASEHPMQEHAHSSERAERDMRDRRQARIDRDGDPASPATLPGQTPHRLTDGVPTARSASSSRLSAHAVASNGSPRPTLSGPHPSSKPTEADVSRQMDPSADSRPQSRADRHSADGDAEHESETGTGLDHATEPASSSIFGITETLSPPPIEDSSPRGTRQSSGYKHLQRLKGDLRGTRVEPLHHASRQTTRVRARSSSRARRSSASSTSSINREQAGAIPPFAQTLGRTRSAKRTTVHDSSDGISQSMQPRPQPLVQSSTQQVPSAGRRAFELASAPPHSGDEDDEVEEGNVGTVRRRRPSLSGERIVTAIISAVSTHAPSERLALLRSLALVSRTYRQAAQTELFRDIRLTEISQLDRILPVLEKSATLSATVQALGLSGLKGSSRRTLVDTIRRLLVLLVNLESLDEDLAIPDWDIADYKAEDYILSPSVPFRLTTFRSGSAWWEISAVQEFFADQSRLESVTFGGAVVDREWAGTKLLAQDVAPSAKNLKRLKVAQVLHEDTLSVLLAATGRQNSKLYQLDIGFQSIDEDTPRSGIVSACRLVASTLKHLSLHAPDQVSSDLTGFLDEIVAELPQLETLEWSEQSETARIPLASARFLEHHLPATLRRLRARSLVSLSTGKVLTMLEHPEVVPSLAELDIKWANGRGDERGREPWYRERHLARIQNTAADLGIVCQVGKST